VTDSTDDKPAVRDAAAPAASGKPAPVKIASAWKRGWIGVATAAGVRFQTRWANRDFARAYGTPEAPRR
jgi:hypothetical protein